jgi:hypothetical protein
MFHLALHVFVPALLGRLIDPTRWVSVSLLMVGTMLVDLDHLIADPIYDPERCSIGFHPLHTALPIGLYLTVAAVAGAAYWAARGPGQRDAGVWRAVFLVGAGLVIHMGLDALDCIV